MTDTSIVEEITIIVDAYRKQIPEGLSIYLDQLLDDLERTLAKRDP